MKRILLAVATLLALTVAQPTFAADAPVYRTEPPPAAAALFNWTGVYAGLQAGYGWGRTQHCETLLLCTSTFDMNGFVGGGTLGYNWQMGSWVAGVETDISYSNMRGSIAPFFPPVGCAPGECRTEVRWFGTLRGRVGPTFDRSFLYVTGGLAFGELYGAIGTPGGGFFSDGRTTKAGWTVGSGWEWAFAPNWSWKLEYLYVDLGSFVYDTINACGAFCSAENNRLSVVRGGVNWRF